MNINQSLKWNKKNYPELCGSRKGICPLCNHISYIEPTLIGKNNMVVSEYCHCCAGLIKNES